ncbi:MAG: LysR family transcriptional regulator [Lachnospiraceae bacterium]|nr:LysR family transcriptional regulator [Lachnospiraceae bacterium]
MNINDFLYITTIAEKGSFTSAAKELYIAQPSLSQRVRHIENTYEISLFTRDAKGTRLTPEGECFVRYAHRILNCEKELRKEIEDMHNVEKRSLRVGGSEQFVGSYLFEQMIIKFNDVHPDVKLEIASHNSSVNQELLLQGKIDIAIIYLPVRSPELACKEIYHDRYVLVPAVGSDLEAAITGRKKKKADAPVDVRLLDRCPFATPTPGTQLYRFATEMQDKYGISLDIQHYGRNYSMLTSLADAGIASTIVLESFFYPDGKGIPYYYLDDPDAQLHIGVVWRKDSYMNNYASEFVSIAGDIRKDTD